MNPNEQPQSINELPKEVQGFVKNKDADGKRLRVPDQNHPDTGGPDYTVYTYEQAVLACPPITKAILGAIATGNEHGLSQVLKVFEVDSNQDSDSD